MMRLLTTFTLLLSLVAVVAANDDIVLPKPPPDQKQPLPPPPNPNSVIKLTAGSLYVITCKSECILRLHPKALVKVRKLSGQVSVFGNFVDGDGTETDRTFDGKSIFIIQAAGVGRVEFDVVPLNLQKEEEVVGGLIDVDDGKVQPLPPPTPPTPQPQPVPDPKMKVGWVLIVEETAQRTPVTAAVINDTKFWGGLGIKYRFYDKDAQDAKSRNYDKFANEVGLPALLLMADDGKKIKAVKLPTSTAGIKSTIDEVSK